MSIATIPLWLVPSARRIVRRANDGTTTVTFRVSEEIQQRLLDASGRMVGGCVEPVTGSANPDCGTYNNGATYAILRFRTIIQDQFTDIHLDPGEFRRPLC